MIDTYIKAKYWLDLKAFLVTEVDGQLMPNVNFQNLITPTRGRAATEACIGEFGPQPAQPAVGDPDYWYTCIRSEEAVELTAGVEVANPDEAIPLIGVWA